MTGELYNVEMTKEDVELFKLFQEHHEKIKGLLIGDIMIIRNGRIILDFDSHGNLMKVKKEYISFSLDR